MVFGHHLKKLGKIILELSVFWIAAGMNSCSGHLHQLVVMMSTESRLSNYALPHGNTEADVADVDLSAAIAVFHQLECDAPTL